ncbi:MAG: hypothetical protein WB579_18145 [Bryobacteraceae bacterium]
MSAKARIAQKAIDLLAQEPEGLRHSVLIERLQAELPDIPVNTIRGCLVGLAEYKPQDVYRPARGLFQHAKYRESGKPEAGETLAPASRAREEDFYASFATYLTEDLEECTKCIPLGGCTFQDKWGTPDVIGIRKSRESDIVKFPTEIITAEIKIDIRNLITAFGQACAYRLFSHRCYLVVPSTSPAEDLARLESLCLALGLGLVLFDSQEASRPNFTIRVRAMRHEPDAFYVNRNLKMIEDRIFE